MLIEETIKLDYKDVLIRPKRSTLSSRKEVDLNRKFNFVNYIPEDMSMEFIRPTTGHFNGIPIMAANMDGVGTFEMADVLLEKGMFTCLVKTYTETQLVVYFDGDNYKRTNHVAMSIGITHKDEMKF